MFFILVTFFYIFNFLNFFQRILIFLLEMLMKFKNFTEDVEKHF